jgi:nitric oxide reductase subunit B
MLVVARKLSEGKVWREGLLSIAFWAMNIGLALMIVLSLLPIGLAQTWASVETGLWYARSADFLRLPWIVSLRWMRMIGDLVFATGVAAYALFMIGLMTGWSYESKPTRALKPVSNGVY